VESFSENYTKNKDRVLLIKYENLVKNPNDQIKKINQYLNLQNKINTNNLNTSNLRGTMGDSFLPSTFDKDMINDNKNWINFYDSIYRKIWAKRFLKKIGQKNLEIMGYNESELFKQIKSKKTLKIISFKDIIGYLQYRLYEIVRKIRFREFGFREVF